MPQRREEEKLHAVRVDPFDEMINCGSNSTNAASEADKKHWRNAKSSVWKYEA